MTACNCPLCGAPIVDDGRVLVDAESGLIVGGGLVVAPTKGEFALFLALWTARPRVLTKAQLAKALYALKPEADEPDIKIIDVFICKLRSKLDGVPLSLETGRGLGYRIITSDRRAPSEAVINDLLQGGMSD